ncbi:MAG: hypothetical protein K2H46_00420 [Muribaculaceae bacterium]|nr:hypothetical protein [Muribaculaceae bacterium]
MCKIYNKLFVLWIALMGSCAQTKDELTPPPTSGETQAVSINLTRGVQDDFITAGVESYTIFVYRNNREDKSLFSEQQVSVNQSNITLQFSLGDNFNIFAVANASSVTGKDNFNDVTLHLNPLSDSQVWMTEVTSFTSDKSVTELDMSMQRIVARVEFAPAESPEDLANQTLFDTLLLNFTNTSDSYKVSDGSVTIKDQNLTVSGADGYKGGFYTFATTTAEESMLGISYLKGGEIVNNTAGALETGIKYSANNRYFMTVPILANEYVETPWSRSSTGVLEGLTVNQTSL